jgi:hypothetical protein
MKDDLTRDTFDPTKHFSRVLMQQGRVALDADHNEQTDILLHLIRTLAADIMGPYAAPAVNGGFQVVVNGTDDLTITAGRLYVDGILVENELDCSYSSQPDYPLLASDALEAELIKPTGLSFWIYLDVWERNITWIEDASIREVALDGPDTCARSKVVWAVKAISATAINEGAAQADTLKSKLAILEKELSQTTDPVERQAIQSKIDSIQQALGASGQQPAQQALTCAGPLSTLSGLSSASMTAQLDPGKQLADPCVTSPSAQYRGAENQLYRVEIHTPGDATTATFKWSRDNGSVATTWLGTSGNDLRVGDTRGFEAGVWVELSDDVLDSQGLPGALVQLTKVEGGVLTVDPSTSATSTAWDPQFVNPKVRRWDQQSSDALQLVDGAVPITEGSATAPIWIGLEDGIQISFSPAGTYRTGDYWLIPARVATGQIEWPATPDPTGVLVNDAVSPDGIQHHYAPLGILTSQNGEFAINPCRCTFNPINNCFANADKTTLGVHPLLAPFNTRAALSVERQRSTRKGKKR